jgi:hypothetical protein
MTTGDAMDTAAGATHDPALALPPNEKHEINPSVGAVGKTPVIGSGGTGIRTAGNYLDADEDGHIGQEGDEWPTEEDLATLRKVPDKISWAAYTVAFIELCERFSYYGTQVICTSPNAVPALYKKINFSFLISHFCSPEFHPETPSKGFHYWRQRCSWPVWCTQYGSEGRNRNWYI